MCSIAGSADKKEVERMLKIMEHRAPDDSGIIEGEFCIGMGRLKIVDLDSVGLCPIVRGGLVLTFNGEIYNYKELREELKTYGHTFNTESDSEVLLIAYKQWGEECLDKFNGMFAFAIYDGDSIFFARDIAGEKPLYYTPSPFRFASEAKALGFKCEELAPAHYGIYEVESRELSIRPYWRGPSRMLDISFDEAVERLGNLLDDSVRLRTGSQVPIGLYFSGGVDSTLIDTYHKFDYRYQYSDGDHRAEFIDKFNTILWHLDYPINSFSAFGLWKLAQEASKEVKVVISGEGADELFGGYVRYVSNEFNRRARATYPSYHQLFPYRDMLKEEFNGNMRELLRMGDRMASAFGLENRCPFLDRRIIEFAMSLPTDFKIRDLETKVILNELLRRRKPDYVFTEKRGLYCNVNEWIGSEDGFGKTDYLAYQHKIWNEFSSRGQQDL